MQAMTCAFACYDVENGRVEGYDVVVNKPKTSAYRAPGSPQAAFGVETTIDELCQQLGVDPIDFRLLNAAKEGTRRIEGPVARRVGLVECLERPETMTTTRLRWKARIAVAAWLRVTG
jgi:CO/xanthine dehydrogenase Mo-binding subunit